MTAKTLESKLNWIKNNPEKFRGYSKKYRTKHPDKVKKYNEKWREEHAAMVREYRKKYDHEHHAEHREYMRRARENPSNRIIDGIRGRIWRFLRGLKSMKTIELVGCSGEYLMDYLAAQFRPGMTRDNYGSVWHVDHIISLSSYGDRIKEPEVQREAFHYTNLQPLFGSENSRKGAKCGRVGATWGLREVRESA